VISILNKLYFDLLNIFCFIVFSVHAYGSNDVGQGAGETLSVVEVDALIGSVGVGLGSNETESDDLAVRVHLTELGQERNGTAHAVRASIFAFIEVSTGGLHAIHEPVVEGVHAPSLSFAVIYASDFSVVRNVFGQLLLDGGTSIIGVNVRGKSARQTDTGRRTNNVTSNVDLRKSSSTSDR